MLFLQSLQDVLCASIGGKSKFCLGVIMGQGRDKPHLIFWPQLFNEQQMFKAIDVGAQLQLLLLEPAIYEHLQRSAPDSFAGFCKQYCCAALLDYMDRVPK